MNLAQAKEIAGQVSTSVSKMPGSAFSTDPRQCETGSRLVHTPGSVCSKCYALRLVQFRKYIGETWARNLDLLQNQDRDLWVKAMTIQIRYAAFVTGEPFHRWFVGGDLPSAEALDRIAEVARRSPEVKHWLPTREFGYVAEWKTKGGKPPRNLIIRVSSALIGQAPRRGFDHTSTVHRKGQTHHGHACPAQNQGNKCGHCRACWDKTVGNVSYPLH